MSTFSKLTSLRELIMIEPYHRSFEEFNPDNHTLPPFLNFLCIDASSLNVISSVPSTSLRKLKIVAQPNDQDDMGTFYTLLFIHSFIHSFIHHHSIFMV